MTDIGIAHAFELRKFPLQVACGFLAMFELDLSENADVRVSEKRTHDNTELAFSEYDRLILSRTECV